MHRLKALCLLCACLLPAACAYKVVQGRRLNAQAAERLLRDVEKIRGLKATSPLRISLEGRKRLRSTAEGDLHRVSFLQRMEDLSQAWVKVGLVPAGTDLAGAYSSVGAEAPAGYYDTSDGILRIIDRQNPRSELIEAAGALKRRDLTDGEILAHEVTHALQDMHFNLDRFLATAPNDDAALARRCLAEGDASFVGYAYSSVFTPSMESWLKFVENRASALDVAGAPDFVNRRFQLPYIQGARFVAMLHRKGGWKAVNAAYLDPPASTEEILHPDKYLAGRDRPVDVRIPAMKRFLGDEWRAIFEDSVGELGLRTVFQRERPLRLAKEKPTAVEAALGWDGDRAAVHARGGELALTWKMAFDSDGDAAQAYFAYRAMMSRYPVFKVIRETETAMAATSSGTGLFLERRGSVVVALEGFAKEIQERAGAAVFEEPDGHAFDDPNAPPPDAGVAAPVEADAGVVENPDAGAAQ